MKYNILAAWHKDLEHKDVIFTIEDHSDDEDLILEVVETLNDIKLRQCIWEVQKDQKE